MKQAIKTTGGNFTRLSDWTEIYHRHIIGGYVSYFDFDGMTYALDEILRLGTPWLSEPMHDFIDIDGSFSSIVGVEATSYMHPIYIELSDCGDYVRVYERERLYEVD